MELNEWAGMEEETPNLVAPSFIMTNVPYY